jgi:mono/diheme cytochrome c family protein
MACSNSTSSSPSVVTETSKNPLPDLKAAAEAGRSLYQVNCALCHGPGGKGDGIAKDAFETKAVDLTANDQLSKPDGKLFLVIKNGKMNGGKMTMPPAKNLTDEQIWQLVAYVRTLSKTQPDTDIR